MVGPTAPGNDDGAAAGQRLDDHDPETLDIAGQHEGVCRHHCVAYPVRGEVAGEIHLTGDPGLDAASFELAADRAVAGQPQPRPGITAERLGKGFDQ